MKKQRKSPPQGEDDEKGPGASTSISHKHDLSDKEFRDEILKMFNELKEMAQQTSRKLKEDIEETME